MKVRVEVKLPPPEGSKEQISGDVMRFFDELNFLHWETSKRWDYPGDKYKSKAGEIPGLIDWESTEQKIVGLLKDWPDKDRGIVTKAVLSVIEDLEREHDEAFEDFSKNGENWSKKYPNFTLARKKLSEILSNS